MESTTTKHECGGPVFGRLVKGCPRCDELAGGAEPVRWAKQNALRMEQVRRDAIDAHNCRASGCGPICTAFDW